MGRRIPSMSSKKLARLLVEGGARFVRQKGTSHAIYERFVAGRRYAAPVQMGKKSLDPDYIKLVLRQLGFTKDEIQKLLDCP